MEMAVAEGNRDVRSPNERATALGPGLLRLADGSYLKPLEAAVDVRCSGPLAYWSVKCTFPETVVELGSEVPLFLYPLPGEAALQKLSVNGEQLLPGRLEVRSLEDLPEDEEVPLPSPSFIAEFGDEKEPVLSLSLTEWTEDIGEGGFQVELEFASGLPTVDGRISLFVPAQVSSDLEPEGETVLELRVVVEDGDELVDDPTAPPAIAADQDGDTLTLQGAMDNPVDPVVVTFRPGRTQMPVRRLRRGENHFIFSIYPPTSIPASPQRRDIVFAVDASENIEPPQFDLIKEDLCRILRTLDENDRFALVTFGRAIDGYDGGEFCDVEQVEAACEWLQDIEPKGRSDVNPLLQRIQSLPSQEDRQLCIFLLAGGHVGNEPAILKSLDFDQSDRRYYTVGIGPSGEQAFLRRLALLTRGRCEVSRNGGCYEALDRLLGQTRALLAEVTFEDQDESDFDAEQLVPSRMTSLTPLGPVHCLGFGSPSSVRFRSKDETGVFFAGTVNAQGTDNPALGSVWAGLRVREILDSVHLTTGAKKKSLKSEATRLAAEYGILTEDTVLVEGTEDGLRLQFGALPQTWGGSDSKEKKSNVSSKDGAAPFDWRKGLVAREGLFKGKSPSDSGESSGRYGLRAKGSNAEISSKPRLDRSVSLSSSTIDEKELIVEQPEAAEFDEVATETETVDRGVADETIATESDGEGVVESVESEESEESDEAAEPAVNEEAASLAAEEAPTPPDRAEPEPSEEVEIASPAEPSGTVPTPVPVASALAPVVHLTTDPLAAGRLRLDSYYSQLDAYDTELSLAAIQGLPDDLSPRGGDLPRILAQTVAHLEKRGYFSHAVSVLGLLLRDSPSTEVYRKMESLLAAWAESLPDEKLPEAIQVLQLGGRACHGSELLSQKAADAHERWMALSGAQSELPVISRLSQQNPDEKLDLLLSEPQVELAKLKVEQQALAQQVAELKQMLEQSVQGRRLPAGTVGVPSVESPPVPSVEPVSATPDLALEEAEPPAQVAEVPAPDGPGEPPVSVGTEPAPVEIPLPTPTGGEPPASVEAEPVPSEITASAPVDATPIPTAEAPAAPDPGPTEVESDDISTEPLDESVEAPPSEGSIEEMALTKEELTEMLLADPRSQESRDAVMASLPEPKDRVNFFREMVKTDKSEPYHSLSLARAYREAGQTKVAVVHFQKYLRADKDSVAYLELAVAYDELGKENLSASARRAAETYKGG